MQCLYGWTYAASIGIEKKSAALGSISKKLNMNDNNYILAGVVSYHQYASDKITGTIQHSYITLNDII